VKALNRVQTCFEEGALRHVEPSKGKAFNSLAFAGEWLNEAATNLASGSYRSALASAYLAMFHAARAILFRDGIREKSHYCVGAYLETYVDQGKLESQWVEVFDRLRSARHTDQYSFEARPTKEELEAKLNTAREFVSRMQKLLEETG
jgi:uncharacterized protein (UPF0332 family)